MPTNEASVSVGPKSALPWFPTILKSLVSGWSNPSGGATYPPGQVTMYVKPTDAPPADSSQPAPPIAAKSPRSMVRPRVSQLSITTLVAPLPFDFERSRLDLLQLLALNRVGDLAVYDDRDILQRAVLDHSGMARMFVHELAQRITGDSEKAYDVVVSSGEYGAVFASRLADALMERYGRSRDVLQRFLELFTPPAEPDSPLPAAEYRLRRSRSDKGYLLTGKRIVLAVPTVTPENWPEVLRQANFLRGEQANGATVRIVALARLGRLTTDAPHGLMIDAIVDFR